MLTIEGSTEVGARVALITVLFAVEAVGKCVGR